MAQRKQVIDNNVYQLKVTLRGSKPPIWRRLQVLSTTTLGQLHVYLQEVMGWYNCHLHSFSINGIEYGQTGPDYGLDLKSEKNVKLSQVVSGEKFKFSYTYDFGDDWEHQILVEKILPSQPETQYPVCLKGKRACPPEDCGGIWGYGELLEVLGNPDHPEYEERLEWVGSIDPEEFDLDDVNDNLLGIN
jgi:Plasmid pRiA4b ORF-3-like protein